MKQEFYSITRLKCKGVILLEKRRLGQTGLEVSIIGFGGIPIQRVDQEMATELFEQDYKKRNKLY